MQESQISDVRAGSRSNITRTRDGCLTCRRRRKKCDQRKPDCTACLRLGLRCEAPTVRLRFLQVEPSMVAAGSTTSTRRFSRRQQDPESSEGFLVTDEEALQQRNDLQSDLLQPANLILQRHEESEHDPRQMHRSPLPSPNSTPPSGHTPPFLSDSGVLSTIPHSVVEPGNSIRGILSGATSSAASITESSKHAPQTLFSPSRNSSQIYSTKRHVPGISSIQYASERYLNHGFSPPLPARAPSTISNSEESPAQSYPREVWFSSVNDAETVSSPSDVDSPAYVAGVLCSAVETEGLLPYKRLFNIHWTREAVKHLPPVFEEIASAGRSFQPLEYAMCAFAGAHLAHMQTKVIKDSTRYGPSEDILEHSQIYYNLAIKCLGSNIGNITSQPTYVLATLLLFMLIEMVIGSFKGVAFHEHGVVSLVQQHPDLYMSSKLDRELIQAWIGLHSMNWANRIPFTIPSCYQDVRSIKGLEMVDMLESASGQNSLITLIMSESHRLSQMILLERYVGRGDAEPIAARCIQFVNRFFGLHPLTIPAWRCKEILPDEDYHAALHDEQTRLDQWFASIPRDDFPIDSHFMERPGAILDHVHHGNEMFRPFQFATQRTALTFVYYIATKIFQSEDVLATWLHVHPSREAVLNATHLFIVLIRAAAGIDLGEAARQNLPTTGLIDVLIRCSSRCPPLPPTKPNLSAASSSQHSRSSSSNRPRASFISGGGAAGNASETVSALEASTMSIKKYLRTFISHMADQAALACLFREGTTAVTSLFQGVERVAVSEDDTGRDYFAFYYSQRWADYSIIQMYSRATKREPAVVFCRQRDNGRFFCDLVEI